VKKALISAFVFVFMLGATLAVAGDGCCAKGKTQAAASMSQKSETKVEAEAKAESETKVEDPHAGCPMHQKASAATTEGEAKVTQVVADPVPSEAAAEVKAAEAAEAKTADMKVPEKGCPEVGEKSAIFNFHETMHPMHVALEEDNYAEVRNLYPKMQATVQGVADYKCANWDKCSEECKAGFNAKKASLVKAVEDLGTACKGEDNAKIDATFGVMHETYISFASMCSHAEPAKMEKATMEKAAEETGAEETK
jgi:hypothetical protein